MGKKLWLTEKRRREIATQASRRMAARGEQPLFRVRLAPAIGGGFIVSEDVLGVEVWVRQRGEAAAAARVVIAKLLECDPLAFEVTTTREL